MTDRDRLLQKLAELAHKYPEERVGQLLCNAIRLSIPNSFEDYNPEKERQLFYIQDADLLKKVENLDAYFEREGSIGRRG